MADSLVALPPQPAEVPFPTERWQESPLGPDIDAAGIAQTCRQLFEDSPSCVAGETRALLLVHRGRIVVERYSGRLAARDEPDVEKDIDRDTSLISWSMAKSITHALTGILVAQGRLDIHAPQPVPAWAKSGDPRSAITLDHMLRMVDGLAYVEDYVDDKVSNVIEMLFGSGQHDVAGYTEARPLLHPAGRVWNYSSGTANVVAALLGRVVGGGAAEMEAFMRRELFDRIGMSSAAPRFDAAGHFIGSSYVWATARDFARFALLYLRDGCWEGARILPEGWVDYARTPSAQSLGEYGAHWWIAMDGSAVFHASGFRGQFIAIDPERDLIVVRLGDSSSDQRGAVFRALRDLIRAFPKLEAR